MPDDIPERLEFETIEVEITIRDTFETNEEYTHSSLITEEQLEQGDRHQHVKQMTDLALDAALRQYLSGVRRGKRGTDDR